MAIKAFKWGFDFKPDVSINSDVIPNWSPDIYHAVVWDHNFNLNVSANASIKIEIAEFTYFKLNLEFSLLRLTLGA
jgi:hypothetical protein